MADPTVNFHLAEDRCAIFKQSYLYPLITVVCCLDGPVKAVQHPSAVL